MKKFIKILVLVLIPHILYSQDSTNTKTQCTEDSLKDFTSHQEKVLNSVFEQRNLLYELYIIDDTLLDNRNFQIKSLEIDLFRTNEKFVLKSQESDVNAVIADNYKALYKQQKRRKNWTIVGFSVETGGLAGLLIWQVIK